MGSDKHIVTGNCSFAIHQGHLINELMMPLTVILHSSKELFGH